MSYGERALELVAEYQAAKAAGDWPQLQGADRHRTLDEIGRDFEAVLRDLAAQS